MRTPSLFPKHQFTDILFDTGTRLKFLLLSFTLEFKIEVNFAEV